MSWSISGVPRIIHTMTLKSQLTGLHRLRRAKAISSPSGKENSSVRKNSFKSCPIPLSRERVTVQNMVKLL